MFGVQEEKPAWVAPPIPCDSAEDTEPKPLDTVMRDEIITGWSKQVKTRGQTGTTEHLFIV